MRFTSLFCGGDHGVRQRRGGHCGSGIGVYGYASAGGRGVYARTNDGGTALEINNGSIRVSGAVTPAFVHVTAAGNISYNTTRIDHPLTDRDANAILIVTHDYGSGPYQTVPVGVRYDAGKWKIFNEDVLVNMTAGAALQRPDHQALTTHASPTLTAR